MKLNKVFLLAGIAVVGLFASCSDDDDYTQGKPASGNQLQSVTFGEDNMYSAEFDPTDPTTYTISVYRDSSSIDKSLELKLSVLVNTDSVFVVPASVTFAEGEAVAQFEVSFPNAEIGVPYTLEVSLDDTYLNPYKADATKSYVLDIQRVKWNKIGLCELYDGFASRNGYYVEIERRDDNSNMFRLINPYAGLFAHPEYEGYGGLTPDAASAPKMIFFTLQPETAKHDNDGDLYCQVTFETWTTGLLYGGAYMIYAFLPSELEESDENSVYYPDYGEIYLSPYYYIPGLGGFGESTLTIVLPHDGIPEDAQAGDLVIQPEEEEVEDEGGEE